MEEKRRNKRIVLDAHLIMKRLDGSKENEKIPVDIVDLSKSGVGFRCDKVLEINSVYEAELMIWTKEVIHTFITVIRFDNSTDENMYGATFVGMPETDLCKISIYDMFEEAKKNGEI